jgi:hypothetical protein
MKSNNKHIIHYAFFYFFFRKLFLASVIAFGSSSPFAQAICFAVISLMVSLKIILIPY